MTDTTDAPVDIHEIEEALDEDNRLTKEFVSFVSEAVAAKDHGLAQELVNPLHSADIADLFELVGEGQRAPLASALGDLVTADVLAEMNEHVREDLIEILEPGEIADLTEQLDTDDAVAIIEDLEEDEQKAVLAEMEPVERAAVESALTYEEETAGRIMQRDLDRGARTYECRRYLIDYLRET